MKIPQAKGVGIVKIMRTGQGVPIGPLPRPECPPPSPHMDDEQIFIIFYKILLTNDFPNSILCLGSKQVPILSTLNLLNAKILLLKA